MKDTRKKDRRKKNLKVAADKRKGPRRLVCSCGGKVEVSDTASGCFVCLRCGKKH